MNAAKHASGRRIVTLVVICFFLSGLSGLIYEILWTRMILKIIGVAPFAESTVVSVFTGGLGLGSNLASRVIDRIKDPIVGFKGDQKLVLENAQKKIVFARQSSDVQLSDPRLICRLVVTEDLKSFFGDGPMNTDRLSLVIAYDSLEQSFDLTIN